MKTGLLLPAVLGLLVALEPCAGQKGSNFAPGRTAMIHLFEWKWDDIAAECERFLGPKGYGGVQVSPINDYLKGLYEMAQRPWWERYQPVSYKIISRSGDETAFKNMVDRCNAVNVRIYVDVGLNHMTSAGPGSSSVGGATNFDGNSFIFPDVPYDASDFTPSELCPSSSGIIENFGDITQIRNCKLSYLPDLNQNSPNVRRIMLSFLNLLVSYGVAGFRFDASRHMWPSDLKAIIDGLDDLPTTKGFPANSKPLVFMEIIDQGGEPIKATDYTPIGRVTEFKYGRLLSNGFFKKTSLAFLENFGLQATTLLPSGDALAFVDNHDNQRGHGGAGDLLTFREAKLYKMGVGFMLAWPYGITRVMSSYYWEQMFVNGTDENSWMGPPHDANYNIVSPLINADGSCGNGWICEHRWPQIYNMVEFRNVVEGTDRTNWWTNNANQVAFCRGDKGFVAINNEDSDLSETLETCLPAGTYCDVISGSVVNGRCSGKSVTVGTDGLAFISIKSTDDDGILAIHAKSKL